MVQVEQPPDATDPAERALALWQAGRTAEAAAAARAILADEPDSIVALNLLAAAALTAGDPRAAAALAERAIVARPVDHRAWNTLGLALRRLDRPRDALRAYRRAAELAPTDPAVLANLGNLLLTLDDPEAALAAFAAALGCPGAPRSTADGLALARDQVMARAVERHNRGELDEADRLYRLVLEARPDDPEALLFRAKALRRRGQAGDAERLLARRLALAADAAALEELGRLRRAQGRPEEAATALAASVRLRPEHAPSWHERAGAELAAGRTDKALASARRAVELAPDDLEARVTLAATEQARGRIEAALAVLEEARPLRRRPRVDAWLAARLSLAGQLGRIEEREQAATELHALLDDPDERARLARELDPAIGMRLAFLLQFTGGDDARRWRFLRLLAGRIDPRPRRPPPVVAPAGQRLRLGYLSPNLGEHPTGHLLAPVLEAHDRDRFEILLYSTMDRSRDPPPYPARLRACADQWRELAGLNDAAVAAAIAADRVHVLIDLGGYLAGGRPGALALRPAPLQLHWIMHLSGMPAPFVDATLVDGTMLPDDHPERLHGPLLRLPDAFQPGYRQAVAADGPSRAECGLPPDGPVLCAFNNPLKIDRTALDAWCAVLRALPDSVLWLSAGPGDRPLEALRAAAAARGVAADRLRFAPRIADRARHLARHRLAALYLDTFAFGGATSAMDALLAGLPVLTCRGAQAYGRIGTSFARVLGLPELTTSDPAGYVARAVELAREPERLARLRIRLERAVASGPLFDAARFTRALEALVVEAWAGRAGPGAPGRA